MMLFKLIDKGDPSIGLPPYNGGLFALEVAPLLASVRLADANIAPIIYDLSHTEHSPGAGRLCQLPRYVSAATRARSTSGC